MNQSNSGRSAAGEFPRRPFIIRFTAVVVGALVAIFPPLAGLAVLCDPLRRKAKEGEFVRVGNLDALPDDGVPRSFAVVATRQDAWTVYPPEPIGAVYLRRQPGQPKPEALTAVCPHLGCFVDFNGAKKIYQCPCHDSTFEVDGVRIKPEECPAPRDMDSLEVEVRDNEIWVKFERFKAGLPEKEVDA